jgi:hypothetical protein
MTVDAALAAFAFRPLPDATAPDATVFIVDDDAGVREALAWLLRSRRLPSERFGSAEEFEACWPSGFRCPASPAACCWTCACRA